MAQRAFKTWLMLLLLPLFVPSAQAQILVDQANTRPGSGFGLTSIQILGPIGQEFKPTFSSLDVVELYTSDFGHNGTIGNGVGADLYVTIRSGTISGPILGTSETLSLPDRFFGITRFDFTSPVVLVPGDTYVIESRVAGGDNWSVGSISNWPQDPYPQGLFYVEGSPRGTEDMWFREGVAVPELDIVGWAVSLAAGGSSLMACRAHRRRKSPQRAGTVSE